MRVVLCPEQAAVGDQVVGENCGLQKSVVAVFAFVGAATAAAVVLQVADRGFAAGVVPALPGPRDAGGGGLRGQGLAARIGEANVR